ncbi:MAG: hypothetical protein NT015_15955 [Alphaproteobacteria bacterium]|nr:hypothetical protein [Alphaproteobacteria bacterium]
MRIVFALFLFACALIASPAEARTVRHPGAAGPGVTIELPDTWTSFVSGVNLIIGDDTHTVGFSIYVGQVEPDFDAIAAAVRPPGMTPLVRGEDMTIDGRTAAAFDAVMTGNGNSLTVKTIMFELSDGHIGSISQLIGRDASPEAIAASQAALQSVRIVE